MFTDQKQLLVKAASSPEIGIRVIRGQLVREYRGVDDSGQVLYENQGGRSLRCTRPTWIKWCNEADRVERLSPLDTL